jgi:putative ribosome biogenesis GTPase RsgA
MVLEAAKRRSGEEEERLRGFVQARRRREAEFHARRKRDVQLAVDFSKQHISVSKALQRHEYLTGKEDRQARNAVFVGDLHEVKRRQNEVIKGYLEKRNELRRQVAVNERDLVEQRLRQDKEMDEYETKKRVEFLKYEQMIRSSKYYDEMLQVRSTYYMFVDPPTPEPGDGDKDAP